MEASKPVLLTVDDDPAVSRAVARDLRAATAQATGSCGPSRGPQALEALREMKLRGEPVAVLLADYRMPEMSGIEFLEQAMDLFPHARRVLLTAYADTDAAIQAINVVDLDHYLLKPWDPPEEKLYPVVDELIELWRDRRGPAGRPRSRWSATAGRRASYEVRDFLARNQVPYRWYCADEPEGRRLLEAAGADATRRAAGGHRRTATRWSTPSDAELAASGRPVDHAGRRLLRPGDRRRRPGRAGRGGVRRLRGAAHRAGRAARPPAGRPARARRIENYLGFPDGVSGAQLTDRARRQAAKFGAEMLTARDVVGLEARRLGPGGPLRRRHARSPRTP